MEEKREFVLCHVGWLVLLLGVEERGCVLSHVSWFVHAASKGRSEKRDQEMVSAVFYVARGGVPGQNGISHSHWMKYINSNSNGPK